MEFLATVQPCLCFFDGPKYLQTGTGLGKDDLQKYHYIQITPKL